MLAWDGVTELRCGWQAADPPVRANVLYMNPKFAAVISSVMCFAQIHRQLAILLIVPEMMLSLSLPAREKN